MDNTPPNSKGDKTPNVPSPELTASTRYIKAVVIGLGVLIVLGMLLLVYGFYKKSTDPDWKLVATSSSDIEVQSATALPMRPSSAFGKLSLGSDNCEMIEKTVTQGPHLYVTACHKIYVIDTVNWKVLGTITP